MTRVLLAGVSTRDIAESAVRAGYEVVAVDGFGDLDLQACATEVHVVRVDGRFSARAAAAAARDVPCEAVVYEASFENHPRAVRALAANRVLWGNPPTVLARARDPRRLARVVGEAGLPGPRVRLTRPGPGARSSWLVKPLRSGGGDGVAVWRRGAPVPRDSYLQERISGVTGSIVFAADGRRAVALGLSRILAGETAFGAEGFRYCGSILGSAGDPQFPADERLLDRATMLAERVTRAFGLVGVNGVDFVARRGLPYAIEVNPRYTAAMELVERAYGISLFDVHVQACRRGLPAFDLAAARRRTPDAVGKAIVYARRASRSARSSRGDETPRPASRPSRAAPPGCIAMASAARRAAHDRSNRRERHLPWLRMRLRRHHDRRDTGSHRGSPQRLRARDRVVRRRDRARGDARERPHRVARAGAHRGRETPHRRNAPTRLSRRRRLLKRCAKGWPSPTG